MVSVKEYEIDRQIKVIQEGGVVEQETRYFDPHLDKTVRLRSKEDELDYRYIQSSWTESPRSSYLSYRYFPEPDLPPLVLAQSLIDEIRASLPELPDEKCRRLQRDYSLPLYDAQVLVDEWGAARFFEARVPQS